MAIAIHGSEEALLLKEKFMAEVSRVAESCRRRRLSERRQATVELPCNDEQWPRRSAPCDHSALCLFHPTYYIPS